MKRVSSFPRWYRPTEAERSRWVQRFQKSGLSQREFSARHGIGLSTLQRWLSKSSCTAPAAGFTEVKLSSLAPRWAAELVRGDGMVLRLAHDAPAELVEQLLPLC